MWIYVPKDFRSSPCAAAAEDSNSASNWLFPMLEQSATLSGKLTPARSWSRAWKTRPWMKHLFGRTCEPLMASRGVERWIASLGAIHALIKEPWSSPSADTEPSRLWLLEIESLPILGDGVPSLPLWLETALHSDASKLEACLDLSRPTSILSMPVTELPSGTMNGGLTNGGSVQPTGFLPNRLPVITLSLRPCPPSKRTGEAGSSGGWSDAILPTDGVSALPRSGARGESTSAQTSAKPICLRNGSPRLDSAPTDPTSEPRPGSPLLASGFMTFSPYSEPAQRESASPAKLSNSMQTAPQPCWKDISAATVTGKNEAVEHGAQPLSARRWLSALLYLPNALMESWLESATATFPITLKLKGAMSGSAPSGSSPFLTVTARLSLRETMAGRGVGPLSHAASVEFITSPLTRTNLMWPMEQSSITASPSVSPADSEEPMILATSGPILPESSEKSNPDGASSRTLPIISISDTVRCDESWKKWVSALRKDSLQRLKSALLTNDSDCSSWRTPDANCGDRFGQHPERRNLERTYTLNDQVRAWWLTPNVPNGGRSVPEATVMAKGQTETGKRTVELESQTRWWSTPKASELDRGVCPSELRRRSPSLQAEAMTWPTPTSRDWKDGACQDANVPTNGLLGRAYGRSSHLAPQMPPDGNESLPAPPISNPPSRRRKLNPFFVECLMGFPKGWTEIGLRIEPIDYDCWEMQSLARLRPLLLAFWRSEWELP